MNLKNIINQISRHETITRQPPVLIDIGASIEVNPIWEQIARFSVCLAFDADDRDFVYEEKEDSGYKKLIKINKIVVDKTTDHGKKKDFFLTNSPYCSSLLEPNTESLKDYHYADLFTVTDKKQMEVIELNEALRLAGIEKIDWFKTDSQGTDLRLLRSLPEDVQNNMIVIDMEPGFINAYKGEDKLAACISYMESKNNFYLTRFNVKGPYRISPGYFNDLYKSKLSKKVIRHILNPVPGWAEITYMNSFKGQKVSSREYLLAWLFSTLQNYHEIAYSYSRSASEQFDDAIFNTLVKYSTDRVKRRFLSFSTMTKMTRVAIRKFFGGKQ